MIFQLFSIHPDRLDTLTGKADGLNLFRSCYLPMFGGVVFQEVAKAFRADGPLGVDYAYYKGFPSQMGGISAGMHSRYLTNEYVDSLGMREALESGIHVLDVGCGAGFHLFELSKQFKKSRFVGVDISE